MAKSKKLSSGNLFVGSCYYCNKQLFSNDGGWIVCADKDPATNEGMFFCHDGRDNSCFDIYGNFCNSLKIDAEFIGYSTFNNNLWKSKPPFKEMIEAFRNKKTSKFTQVFTQKTIGAKKG